MHRNELKPRTFDAYETKLKIVGLTLGSLDVNAVELEDVERAFARWTRKKHREASAPNPAAMIKKNRERSGGRGLSPSELERIGQELAVEEAERPDAADTVAAIRLLVLTGCRRREITDLTWPEVDFEERCLRLADSKTGAKVVPLNSAALVVLSGLPRKGDEMRVFPATRHEVGFAIQYTWRRVRERGGCANARLHDLRHTFVTRGLAANFSETIVGRLVGHKSSATTRRYEHLQAGPLREAVERIGTDLAGDLEGRQKAEVVSLGGRETTDP